MAVLKAGTRLRSAVCTTEMMIVAAPKEEVELTCGGAPVIEMGAGIICQRARLGCNFSQMILQADHPPGDMIGVWLQPRIVLNQLRDNIAHTRRVTRPATEDTENRVGWLCL